MGVLSTVVFTDLTGSTSAFEALGNSRATRAVTQLTVWICDVLQSRGGQVIKTLGDGVLTVFEDTQAAVHAVVDLQRQHQANLLQQPMAEHLPIRVGVATGDVEIINGDCYGDAVNIASRLSDLAGPHEIWMEKTDYDFSSRDHGIRYRPLGPISVRGRVEPCHVYQVEWLEDQSTDFITMQGELATGSRVIRDEMTSVEVQLQHADQLRIYKPADFPVQIGRIRTCEFVVADPRVSRTHARLDWRNGRALLVDVSTYGTWVKFAGARSELLLRREECVLLGKGEISLGASFADASAPVVAFEVR